MKPVNQLNRSRGNNMEVEFKIINEVPERFTGKRKIVLSWLLKHADKVEIANRKGGRSLYKVYFDDGVYKGGTSFTFNHQQMTPLNIYMAVQETGWPGFNLKWLEDIAEEEMQRELESTKQEQMTL